MSKAIEAALQKFVDSQQLAGAATLLWRADLGTHAACVGWRDIEASLPMRRDTIFRIASMSKPIASVAALMLLEEGRISLSAPIARYAPEFAHMRVLRSPNGALDETGPAQREITFEDLLTHRAGFTYADFHRGPIAQAYRDSLGGDIDSGVAPDDWIARLAQLPLIAQPGSAMYYGRSTDLLGLLDLENRRSPARTSAEASHFRSPRRHEGTPASACRSKAVATAPLPTVSDNEGRFNQTAFLGRRSRRRTPR